jgi:hypothetical protein
LLGAEHSSFRKRIQYERFASAPKVRKVTRQGVIVWISIVMRQDARQSCPTSPASRSRAAAALPNAVDRLAQQISQRQLPEISRDSIVETQIGNPGLHQYPKPPEDSGTLELLIQNLKSKISAAGLA